MSINSLSFSKELSKGKVLTLMIEQYRARHNRLPKAVLVSPAALAVLAAKRSIAPQWGVVPVQCVDDFQNINTQDSLGVDVNADGESLKAFDL